MAKKKLPPFVLVTREMLKDIRFKKLSSSAKIAFIYLKEKLNPKYGNEVILTYKEMESVMHKRHYAKALKELTEAEFIKKSNQGGMLKNANRFILLGDYGAIFYKGVKLKTKE
jgi:hypothetical protein